MTGAGDGNRTHVRSLGSFYTAIVRRPLIFKVNRFYHPMQLPQTASGHNWSQSGLLEWDLANKSEIFRPIIEDAITTKEFATAYRALLEIATRHVKFALENLAIRARVFIYSPVIVLVAVTNAGDGPPLLSKRRNLLSSHNFLRPALNHRNAAVKNVLRFGHGVIAFLIFGDYTTNSWFVRRQNEIA